MARHIVGVVEFCTLRRRQVFVAVGVGIVSLEHVAEQLDIRVLSHFCALHERRSHIRVGSWFKVVAGHNYYNEIIRR